MSSATPEFIDYNAVVYTLALAFIAGEQTLHACIARATIAVGEGEGWLTPLATRYLHEYSGNARPRQRDVARFLLSELLWSADDPGDEENSEQNTGEIAEVKLANIKVRSWLLLPTLMRPIALAADWHLPAIETVADLAAWLSVSVTELEWLADIKTLLRRHRESPLHHYHYRVVQKQSGGIRLVEAPQKRLKQIQRKILAEILDRVPNDNAAHGFVKGRSVQTFATPHVSKRVVLRMDLQDFFPRINRARVQAVFRTLGYPESVADTLGALCSNTTPSAVLSGAQLPTTNVRTLFDVRQLYCRPHLPQGAPTSPALANMCAYHLDRRLTALAHLVGAEYTRYADDLAFSGGDEFRRHVERYSTEVATIVSDEGWSVHHRKTRIMNQSVRQHLAGIVVNEKLNVTRRDYDAIKATLTNCVRLGASSQNRDGFPNFRAHLRGRVAWVASVNAGRGKRLRQILEQVKW
ncbi:MAG: reverse transcriptase family protein [Gemmatimonadaceae bacterium]